MANIVTLGEVHAAQVFLRAIGANWHNSNMIYAVVAWMRTASGGRIVGNNPLGLLAGEDINYLSNGKTRIFEHKLLLSFKSIDQAMLAAAVRFLKSGNDTRGFGLVIRAAKTNDPFNFMNALAISGFTEDHYGWDGFDPKSNRVTAMYSTFTGMQVLQPAQPHKLALPQAPGSLAAPDTRHAYIDPWRVLGFYTERHRKTGILGEK